MTVAGAVIERDGGLLLVKNRRRNGAHDWSTPGGVIDPTDASILEGLAREVEEETGLVVHAWEGPLYSVTAVAIEMGWSMHCEVHRAVEFSGELRVDDPDGIVVDAAFVTPDLVDQPPRRLLPLGARPVGGVVARPLAGRGRPHLPLRDRRDEPRRLRGRRRLRGVIEATTSAYRRRGRRAGPERLCERRR